MTDPFWTAVKAQLTELRTAASADDVIRILSPERNPHGTGRSGMDERADGFFHGSGGDGTVDDALDDAGWVYVWSRANYWWAMRAPNGDVVTYCEGDIYRGDKR